MNQSVPISCFTSFLDTDNALPIPKRLNDPFAAEIPAIAKLAVHELQAYLRQHQDGWLHDFTGRKGKMFGVLVVENQVGELGYLSTFSGKMEDEPHPEMFVPSLFDIATHDHFISKGMLTLSDIGRQIEGLRNPQTIENQSKIAQLKQARKSLSLRLQQTLFDQYVFQNHLGISKSLCEIFADYAAKRPPSGAGECAAPKLLQYAFVHKMKPLAIAEFWWGKSPASAAKKHLSYYPACEDKCRPILDFMLN